MQCILRCNALAMALGIPKTVSLKMKVVDRKNV